VEAEGRVRSTVIRAFTCLALRIAIKTGPEVGQPVPDFSAKGLESRTQTLRSTMDPKGAEPVFFRSADGGHSASSSSSSWSKI
jgi:hypothetical protein